MKEGEREKNILQVYGKYMYIVIHVVAAVIVVM